MITVGRVREVRCQIHTVELASPDVETFWSAAVGYCSGYDGMDTCRHLFEYFIERVQSYELIAQDCELRPNNEPRYTIGT